jgi:hypothetical protein
MHLRSPGSVRLAPPFAALGIAWGAQVASLLRVGCFEHDGPLEATLVLLVPITLAAVGVVVGQHTHRRVLPFAGVALSSVAGAGLIVGVSVGILWWPPDGILIGAHDGLVFGVASVPFLLPALIAARDDGRARRASLLDKVDAYGTWGAVGASCALSSVATLPHWNAYPRCSTTGTDLATPSGTVGIACCGLGLMLTVVMWIAQRSLTARIHAVRTAALGPLPRSPVFVDLGVGDTHWEREASVPTAYRSVHSAELVVRGDPATAYEAARQSARRTAVLAGISAAASGVCALLV